MPGSRGPFVDERVSAAGEHHVFGAEVAARFGSAGALGREAAGSAGVHHYFGAEVPRTGRAIPAAVKREIWQRYEGRCGYIDPRTGRRCASRHLLQVDHVFPHALGGDAEPANLRLLCAAHHRHRHAERASARDPAE